MVYQPKANLSTQSILGFEALLRWQHPEMGAISPHEFIPIAEHSGVIQEIGNWVIRKSCKQLELWQNLSKKPLTLAINLSAQQLHQESFVEETLSTIEGTGINPTYLEFEITESTSINNPILIREKKEN